MKMEYQVTATRRRPQRFDELLGQDFVAATLQKSIEAGKIAHAYLFSGPRGCGKTSSARILAKALNCEQGPTATPCGVCTACKEITAGSNLDVIEIDGASNTGVDDVRKIKDEILFPPNAGRYKIYIIDEVHMLSTSAFNALLKTIEEPPPYVIFIFATTELHKVPATIKSRCQQFHFKLVDVETLRDALASAASEQGITADDEALFWIAREATGSVRDAYTLFDQVAAFSDGHITFEKIQDKLGLTGLDVINKLFVACVNKNANEALHILDEVMRNGVSVEQFIIDCTKYLRSLLLVQQGITKEAIIGQKADRFPVEILESWNAIQIERALHLMLQLFKDIRFSVNPRYELELAVSRLSWLTDYVSPAELKNAYMKMRQLLKNGVSNASESTGTSDGNSVQQPTENQNRNQLANAFNDMMGHTIKQNGPTTGKITNSPPREDEPPIDSYDGVANPFPKASSFNSQKATIDQQNRKETTRKCEFDKLKEVVISAFTLSDAVIATALNATEDWILDNKKIILPVKRNFDIVMLNKNKQAIFEKIRELFAEDVTLEFQEVKAEEESTDDKEEIDATPKIVHDAVRILRGEIIGEYLDEEMNQESKEYETKDKDVEEENEL